MSTSSFSSKTNTYRQKRYHPQEHMTAKTTPTASFLSQSVSSGSTTAPAPSSSRASRFGPTMTRDASGYCYRTDTDTPERPTKLESNEGLPVYTSPDNGTPLSSLDHSMLHAQQRAEYIKVTKRRILPKIIALAQRLLPAVSAEMMVGEEFSTEAKKSEGGGMLGKDQNGVLSDSHFSRNHERKAGLKTTGLYDEDLDDDNNDDYVDDLENGGSTVFNHLCLPQSAALAALGDEVPLATSGKVESDGVLSALEGKGSGQVVPVDAIAAGLSPDVALLDFEADALLHSIRNETFSPPSTKQLFKQRDNDEDHDYDSDDNAYEHDERSVTSYDTEDDDGMGGEIRRLGSVVDSLRRDLAGANFDRMEQDKKAAVLPPVPNLDNEQSNQRTSNRRNRGAGMATRGGLLSISWGSAETADLASNLKTWRTYGAPGWDGRNSNAPLYWAVALIWAVIILLAGHVQFSSFHGDDGLSSWPDVFEWLFGGRL